MLVRRVFKKALLTLVVTLGAFFVWLSNANAQPAEVKIELAGTMNPPCSAPVDGAIATELRHTLKISAKSAVLQDGATLGFIVYSPDGSITDLNSFSQPQLSPDWDGTMYWDLGTGLLNSMVDGALPDSFLTGGVAIPGAGFLEPDFVEILTFDFSTPNTEGIICFDSAFIPPLGSWLMSPGGPPVFHGGIGDTGVGGTSESALCFETKWVWWDPPLLFHFPESLTGPYCLPITFEGFFLDADPGQSNELIGFSHDGNGVLTQIDGITFTYTPTPSDSGNHVTLRFDGEVLVTDICGKSTPRPATAYVDLNITTPCPDCCFLAGDADHSGMVNIADVTFAIARIFSGGPAPICINEADANGDNAFNIADVTHLIQFIFNNGAAPVCGTQGL